MFKPVSIKLAFAAAVALASFALPAQPALAKVNIYIGLPGLGYWNGPGNYNGYYRDRLTCAEGRRIVDRRGYNAVRAIDCSPRYYKYRARKNGRWNIVELDSRTGAIIRISR
jgi:hypothetical protein